MIGNDVIDLDYAKKTHQWQRPRFLQKIFTEQECLKIEQANDKELMVWVIWSQKESIYKILSREKGERFFAPKKLDTNLPNFELTTLIEDGAISTVATIKKQLIVHQKTFLLKDIDYKTQHHTTYQQLIAHYARLSHLPQDELSIQKNNIGVPSLYYKNLHQPALISMSHHGFFGSYAITLI